MNPTPHQPEAGREHLLRALAALPAHIPDDDTLWPRISSQLALEQAIYTLPTHTPDPVPCDCISAQLDPPEPPPAALAPSSTAFSAAWAATGLSISILACRFGCYRARVRPCPTRELTWSLACALAWQWGVRAVSKLAYYPVNEVEMQQLESGVAEWRILTPDSNCCVSTPCTLTWKLL